MPGAFKAPLPSARASKRANKTPARPSWGFGPLALELRAPWKWEELLVDAAVIGGKERWARRLDGLQSQFKLDLEEHAKEQPDSPRVAGILRKLRNLQHLRAFALPVIDELAALPESATWGEWIAALEQLVPRVLRQPERVLAVLADLKPMGPVASVPLAEVQNVLQHWLANLQQQPPESRYGRVLVATPEQARGRSFDIVFISGLAERMFPQKLREDPLLLDKLRRQLSSDLPVLPDRSQQERLLLQIAVGAASRRLYLSYPRLEVAEARARVPSFYALDVARSITGYVPDYEVLAREAERSGASRLAWPAPRDSSEAIDDAEYDLAKVWPLLNTNQPRAGRLAYVMKLNLHLKRSLRGRWARWQDKWSEHDGLVTKRPSIVEILESQRLAARPYSVSALQNFAACPYRFLLSAIYRLEPREEPAPLEEMDPLTKGGLFHRIQAELQRELKDKGLLPVKAAQLPQALKMLDQTVKRVADEAYEELAPAIDRVWLDAIEAMRSDLRVWLQKVADEDGWVPIHFEFGFGFGATEGRDPASLPDPVTLPGGAMVHGFVDLIERSDDGKTLRVTDHKTGKDRTKKGLVVGQGEYLQPAVYGLAVEVALKRTVAEGRFFYCTADGGFIERCIPLDPIARQSAEFVLRTIDDGIAAPFLAAAPREDACVYCDFQEVCGPYEEIRFARKKEISRARAAESHEGPGLMKLLDQNARDAVRNALDKTLVVEAAAGTGKTSELVQRMIAVVAAGKTTIDRIAGVTFTEKAAGELKLRLRSELEKARRAEQNSATRNHLEQALAHLEEARLSTIHSFCGDLLKERPVEARIDPQFELMTEAQSLRLYREAFRSWFERKLEDLPEGTRRILRRKTRNSPTETLISAGWELSKWRDFSAKWRRPAFDRKAAIDDLVEKIDELARLTSDPSDPAHNLFRDTAPARTLSENIRAAERTRPRDYDGLEATFVLIASDGQYERFRDPRKGKAQYSQQVKRDDILALHGELLAAIDAFVSDANSDLAALLQTELGETVAQYQLLKERTGRLDFLDLLIRARDLLVQSPSVRKHFQERFTHLFVDEFQDTDPLQAEITCPALGQ